MTQPSRQVMETYHQMIQEKTKTVIRILVIIMTVFIVNAGLMVVIRDRLNDAFLVLFLISTGISLALAVAALIVRKTFVSEKPLYRFLMPKMIEELLYHEDLKISYEPYPKPSKVIAESKLFWKHAGNSARAGYAFDSKQSFPVTVYDTYCYTQTSESTVVHFNGFFIAIEGVHTTPIQIRTKGRPSRSKVHSIKTQNEKRLKVYCQNEHAASNHQVMALYKVFDQTFAPKNLFVSTLDRVIYVALDLKKPLRKIRVLNTQSYQALKDGLIRLIETIDLAIEKVSE